MEEFGNLLLESNKTLQSNLNNVDDRLNNVDDRLKTVETELSTRQPGEIYKVHIIPTQEYFIFTPPSEGEGFTAFTANFNKKAGTHLYAEAHYVALVNGHGDDHIYARIKMANSTAFVNYGEWYETRWQRNGAFAGWLGGGGHRSLGGSQPAASSAEPAADTPMYDAQTSALSNKAYEGQLTIEMKIGANATGAQLDDQVYFRHGFFKIFEIWA